MLSPNDSPLIVASRTDPASFNIAQNLIQHHGFELAGQSGPRPNLYKRGDVNLILVDRECIHVGPQDIPVTAGFIIFASKHRSNTETPALTVHATGNLFREAKYGGEPEEVSFVEPSRISAALSSLANGVKREKFRIEVTMEATHHGPTSFQVPVLFLEIGSGREEWTNPILGRIAADAAVSATVNNLTAPTNAVGFGGTHYPAKHTLLNLQGTHAIGHVVSKYAIEARVSDKIIQDTFTKTVGGCRTAVVDWKGLKGEQRRVLVDKLSGWNIDIVRS